jgi:hypothetical protein
MNFQDYILNKLMCFKLYENALYLFVKEAKKLGTSKLKLNKELNKTTKEYNKNLKYR